MATKKPVILTILDGVALRDETHGNAFAQANKPNFDRYWNQYPHATLRASGEAVGLPDGQMGNSEVGHLNIGAGRVVYQSLTLINKSIKDGDFFENEMLNKAIDEAKANGKKVHLFGLLSDGGVHSHINHMFAVLELAAKKDFKDIYVHAFLDGRDVAPDSGVKFVADLQNKIAELGVGYIASISGRYYAMDRDKRWDRVELAYNAVVLGEGEAITDPVQYVKDSYAKDTFDEFVLPGVVAGVNGKVEDGDSVIFANFRPDRAIQLSSVLTNPNYDSFVPKFRPSNLTFICMMKYADTVSNYQVAYTPQKLDNVFGDVVSAAGLNQLRTAETEKYPHVTFFFDGGIEKELPGATRLLINSPKVATYDLQPEMSAYELTDAVLAEINKDYLDVIILNFANCDMVGHSGMLEPTIKAVEAVDECLGKIVDRIIELGGAALITADHGNSDEVLTDEDQPMTAHTARPVPVILTKEGVTLRTDGALCDLAPTLLDLLHVDKPAEMTGSTLVAK